MGKNQNFKTVLPGFFTKNKIDNTLKSKNIIKILSFFFTNQ